MSIIREFTLYLHAGITTPEVIHANQYSQGETWIFKLLQDDGSVYVPSTGALIGVKADGHAIAGLTGTVLGDGRVSITTTQQLTAAAGDATCELTIDGGTNGSANFVIRVEKKPTDDAILSESDLSIIQEGLNSVTPAAINESVSNYLEENLTDPPIDPTLSISNAAADAKVTGDKLTELKTTINTLAELQAISINEINPTITTTSGYVYLNGSVVSSTSYEYTNKIPVNEGDVILTYGGTGNAGQRSFVAYVNGTANESKGGEYQGTYSAPYIVPQGVTEIIINFFATSSDKRVVIRRCTDANIIKMNDALLELYDVELASYDSVANQSTLRDYGYAASSTAYKIYRYAVTAGDLLKVESDYRFQFFSELAVPTPNYVGLLYEDGTYIVEVPQGATYLFLCTPTSNGTAKCYKVNGTVLDTMTNAGESWEV